MFHRCRLIRADLSEHTIVVRGGRAVWTGAARMVELENASASVLLRRGIAAITQFFRAAGIATAPLMRAFQFVIAPMLEAGLHAVLAEMRVETENMSATEFVERFAPHTLAGVNDAELARGLVRVPGVAEWQEEEEEEIESDDEDDGGEGSEARETVARRQLSRTEWKAKVRDIKFANREHRRAHRQGRKRDRHRNTK